MMMMVMMMGAACCCCLSIAAPVLLYFVDQPFKDWINGLFGTSTPAETSSAPYIDTGTSKPVSACDSQGHYQAPGQTGCNAGYSLDPNKRGRCIRNCNTSFTGRWWMATNKDGNPGWICPPGYKDTGKNWSADGNNSCGTNDPGCIGGGAGAGAQCQWKSHGFDDCYVKGGSSPYLACKLNNNYVYPTPPKAS